MPDKMIEHRGRPVAGALWVTTVILAHSKRDDVSTGLQPPDELTRQWRGQMLVVVMMIRSP